MFKILANHLNSKSFGFCLLNYNPWTYIYVPNLGFLTFIPLSRKSYYVSVFRLVDFLPWGFGDLDAICSFFPLTGSIVGSSL